jgi:hypothetical protein
MAVTLFRLPSSSCFPKASPGIKKANPKPIKKMLHPSLHPDPGISDLSVRIVVPLDGSSKIMFQVGHKAIAPASLKFGIHQREAMKRPVSLVM